MVRRTLIAALAALAVSFGLRAQEVTIMDVSAMVSEGRFEEALPVLDTLMAADSLDDAVWYYRGACLLDLGRCAESAVALERAVELDPSNASYYEDLHSAYSCMGKEDKADSLIREMAALFPRQYRTPYALVRLAQHAWLEERNDSLALRYFEEALATDEEYPAALYGKAEVSLEMGNYLGYFTTVEAFMRALYLTADVKCSYLERVVKRLDGPTYRIWHKQIDGIMDAFVQTHPTDSCALVPAGQWFYSTDQKEKGISYFKQWKDSNPWNFNAAMLWISVVAGEGTDAEVVAACDDALKSFKQPEQRVELYCVKADYLYKLGKKSKAFRTYEKALKINPEHLMTLNNYAYFLSLEKRNLSKAEKMSRKTVEAEPDNVNSLDTYGYILYLLKRPAEAKTYFKKAMIYGGKDNETVLYHYYLVLKALGEKELALYYKSLYDAKLLQK